jgi:hypothetical protein
MEIVRGLEGGIGDVARKRDDIIDACVGVSDLIGGAVVRVGVVDFGTPATEAEALRE